jgi:hypothetical protein
MHRGVFVLLLSLTGGCIHQGRPDEPMTREIALERSVFPLYVTHEPELQFRGKTSIVTPYDGCSATYVAPGVLATVANPFKDRADLRRATVLDGVAELHVKRVRVVDRTSGLTFIETEEPGAPVALRASDVRSGERLAYVGHAFTPGAPEFQAAPSWTSGALVAKSRSGRASYLDAERKLDRPCAFPVFDAERKLVGIVRWKRGRSVAVIEARKIAEALRRP